jgi:hypothetical protein
LSITSLTPWAWLPLGVALPMLIFAARSLVHSANRWSEVTERSRVVTLVSSG